MSVVTTIEIPDEIYARLRARAEQVHVSIPSLVISTISDEFHVMAKDPTQPCVPMTGPLVGGDGMRGPLYPDTETPYDLIFG